jgi:hypothetical protein
MPNLNFLVSIRSYSDKNPSNDPSLNNIRWTREIDGVTVQKPWSAAFQLAPGESKTFFNGSRSLAQDNSTAYSISLVPLSSNTYQMAWSGGTAPNFRTPRNTGADATTQVTSTINGPLVTFASTAGTPLSLGSVVVGDYVRLGNLFSQSNQVEQKIIAVTSTSFTVANDLGVAEGPITLGSGFASQIQIYSAAGVQVGDTLLIPAGFSAVTQGSYQITSVAANYLQFYSTAALPVESNITTEVTIFGSARSFLYLEVDQNCQVQLNNTGPIVPIKPFIVNNSVQPGIFMNSSLMYAVTVTNTSTNMANCFLAAAE